MPEYDASSFTKYLRGTLIPDLRASGFDATADDFETALQLIAKEQSCMTCKHQPNPRTKEPCQVCWQINSRLGVNLSHWSPK